MKEELKRNTTETPVSVMPGHRKSLSVVIAENYSVLHIDGKPNFLVQSNPFITDTKGTGISVPIIEVSFLEK